jgi:hypothetical protein
MTTSRHQAQAITQQAYEQLEHSTDIDLSYLELLLEQLETGVKPPGDVVQSAIGFIQGLGTSEALDLANLQMMLEQIAWVGDVPEPLPRGWQN